MNTLHPHTVCSNESTPSTDELLSDANVRSLGNNYETAVAEQEQAEALFAALACDDAEHEALLAADAEELARDQQQRDEFEARAAMRTIRDRYGLRRFNAVLLEIEREALDAEQASLRNTTNRAIGAMREFLVAEPNVSPVIASIFA